MRELSLFSGAGGGLLGTKLLGWSHCGYVEFNEYCQKVIAQRIADGHLDRAPIYGDVRGAETVDFYASLSYNGDSLEETNMSAHRKQHLDQAAIMYQNGFSIGEIGHHYGVTRQSMYASLKRRGVVFRDKLKYGEDNHFYRGGFRAVDRVHNLTETAIQRGFLVTPKVCQQCNFDGVFQDGRTAIQAHHCDYNKPMDVMWLCQKCHHEWHKHNTAIEFKEDSEASSKCDVITGGFP